MTKLTIIEAKNAFLFFMAISIAFAFFRMLVTDKQNWTQAYYGAMIGVCTFFVGFASNQFFYWIWRHYGEGTLEWLTIPRLLTLEFTGLLMAVGAACIVRNFTVARFGHRIWLMVLVASTAAALGLVSLPHVFPNELPLLPNVGMESEK